MRILILGGTGFVGLPLAASLLGQGHSVVVTSRHEHPVLLPHHLSPGFARWDGADAEVLARILAPMDVVINLVGESIGAGRWSVPRKQRIMQSRCQAGEALITALRHMRKEGGRMPHTLLQASATGYYGLWDDFHSAPTCTEQCPQGQGFLAETCAAWETSTEAAPSLGVRRCILRLAPILGRHFSPDDDNGRPHGPTGGFVRRMLPAFRYCLGGTLGSGAQPLSWVHMDDVLGAVHLLLRRRDVDGIFNICAPYAETMHHMCTALGKALGRPTLLPLPGPILRLALGEMAEELILAGQKTVPQHLLSAGYDFRYPRITMALREIL